LAVIFVLGKKAAILNGVWFLSRIDTKSFGGKILYYVAGFFQSKVKVFV